MKNMIFRELRRHQWKASRRHPLFERNIVVKVFMYISFGMFGMQFLLFGFFLFDILSKYGMYDSEIASFNYIILYLLLFDFIIKYFWKRSSSMQIAPYLTLPVKRNTLFKFLLIKEFANIWNLYFFFMLIPFTIKAIPAYYGYPGVFLYLLFFYVISICISLLVNIEKNMISRNGWFLFLPVIIVVAIVGITIIPGVNIEDSIVKLCEFILKGNTIAWMVVAVIFAGLWRFNLLMMNEEVYRAMQGKSGSKTGSSFNIPFTNKLGKIGILINLEFKMITRSKMLKNQLYIGLFYVIFYFLMLNKPHFQSSTFVMLFFTIFAVCWLGLTMSQRIFTTESLYFDGLISRNLSLLDMLRAKYIFYVSYSVLILFILMAPVYLGRIGFLYIVSSFFYCIGFLFFLMFQNAVYNKSYLDHLESEMFILKLPSGNVFIISLIGMLFPVTIVVIIEAIFNMNIAVYFMLITGFVFTITANYWLRWTYNRFLKRRYENMEGFRIKT